VAIRKSTMQEQVAQAIAEINPTDRPIVTFHTMAGMSPYLLSLVGTIGQAFIKYYFVTLTEQAVVFHRASRMSNRPKELVVAIPRAQAAAGLGQVKPATLWSHLYYQLPNEPKPSRLNVHRIWRSEMETFVSALTGQPVGV
jgi:hypothetical protein